MAISSQDLRGKSVNLCDEEEKRGAAFKYGLSAPFITKFPFEDREDVPNSEFYDSSDDEDDYFGFRELRPANAFEVVKRFLKQVRESNGYDVDCCPPPSLGSPFSPVLLDLVDVGYLNSKMGVIQFAIDKINAQMGKSYVFVKLERVVNTICTLILLTFTVKEEVDSSQLKTIRAMVKVPYGTKNYELEEWTFKPPAPTTTDSYETMDAKKAKTGEVTSNLIRLSSFESSLFEQILSYLDDKSVAKLASTCQSFRSVTALLKKDETRGSV